MHFNFKSMELVNLLRLRDVLKKKNVTGKELAQMLNLTETSVSRILNGTQIPKLETLLSIATALQVDIKDLFNSTATDTTPLYIKDDNGNFVEVGSLLMNNVTMNNEQLENE